MATAQIEYISQLRTECTHIKSGKTFITDAPTDNKGKGNAFSPTDTAATALASCMLTIMGIYAIEKDFDLNGSKAIITKHMSAEKPRKIIKIDIDMTVSATKTLNKKEKLSIERAAKTCPVALSLHPEIEQNLKLSFVK
jgi:uncharacterized OsmC-like protein